MDKKLIIGAIFVLLTTIIYGVVTAEDIDQIGHRYFLVSDVDSMMAYGDSHCGPDKSFASNRLALKWYQKAADKGNAIAMVRMGTIYREGWSDEESYWKAINYYQDAIGVDSMNIEALTEAGGTFGLKAGNYEIGHSYLDTALEIDSTYLDALWYKVLLYDKQDNVILMSKTLQKIRDIDSTFLERKLKEKNNE